MSNMAKTWAFLLVGCAAMVLAFEPWRPVPKTDLLQAAQRRLFPALKDAAQVTSLEILQYDEETSALRPFRVAQDKDGLWSIPSHQNYPADAQEHLAQAATSIMGLEYLTAPSNVPGEQALFGVVDPDPKNLKAGATGVGLRVTLKGAQDKVWADLIIGKPVKDQPQQRYVRRPKQDQIYTVALAPEKLSLKFEDWIERNLLKFSSNDLKEVQTNDYSISIEESPDGRLGVATDQHGNMRLGYNDAKQAWDLLELNKFKDGKPIEAKLAEDEELNSDALRELKTALSDLKIVDVERKPAGLSADLRATDEFVKDNAAAESLMERGFIPVRLRGQLNLLTNYGEVVCQMKDGVEYVLRFGGATGGTSEDKKDEANDATIKGKEKPDEPKTKGTQLNRYLFVMARFNPDVISKPKIKPLPGEEELKEPGKAEPDEGTDETTPGAKAEKPAQPAKGADESKPAAKPAAPKSASSAKSSAAPEVKTADQQPDADENPADAEVAPPSDAAKVEAGQTEEERRSAIEKENKRQQTDYDNKVNKAQEHVKELNNRFADWYYIISDDMYKKIHLGRDEVVKKKVAKDAHDHDDDGLPSSPFKLPDAPKATPQKPAKPAETPKKPAAGPQKMPAKPKK